MNIERKRILQNEFRYLQIDLDQEISESLIFKFLDEKSGGTFDNSIALQLHQQVVTQYSKLTINNFINVYIEAEQLLKSKLDKANIEIQNLTAIKSQSQYALINLEKIERLNHYGIMDQSLLTLNCIHAQINKLSLSMKIFVLISSANTSFQTSAQNEMNWNDTFEFPIETGQEIIKINVKAYQGNQTIDIGEAEIYLQQFNNQAQTDIEVKLKCQKPYNGIIYLSGIWIYSKVKYFKELIKQLDIQITQLKEDVHDFQQDLDTLLSIVQGTMKSHSDGQNNIYFESPEKQPNHLGNIELQTLTKYLVAIMILLITLSSLNRTCFFDILIILVYSLNLKNQTLDSQLLKKIAISAFFSFLLDIIWVVNFVVPLWSQIDTPDMGIQKIIVVTGLLLFLTKLPFSFLCAYLSHLAQKIIPEFQIRENENNLSGLQPLEYQNISRNESLSSYQQIQ